MSPLCPLYFLMLYTSVLSAPNHLPSGIQNEGEGFIQTTGPAAWVCYFAICGFGN